MGFYIAPGTYVREIDLSTVIPAVLTSVGALVGYSEKGPVSEAVLVTNTKDFIDIYGEPTPGNYFHYSALAFLNKAKNMYAVRTAVASLYGGLIARTFVSLNKTAAFSAGESDPTAYTFQWDDETVGAVTLITDNGGGTGSGDDIVFTEKDGFGAFVSIEVVDGGVAAPLAIAEDTETGIITITMDAASPSLCSDVITYCTTNPLTMTEIPTATTPTDEMEVQTAVDSVGGTAADDQELFVIYAANQGTWNNDLKILIDNVVAADYEFDITVYQLDENGDWQTVEKETVSRKDKLNGYGTSMYIEDVFENSAYIRVFDNTTAADTELPEEMASASVAVQFSGGANGTAPAVGDFNTDLETIFKNPLDLDISIIIGGGNVDAAWEQKIIEIAEYRKDCMGVLDVPYDPEGTTYPQAVVDFREDTLVTSTSYAALYSPWLKIYDSYNDKQIFIPPSGYVAAVYAYTDYISDPWMPPAGLNRGLLNVLDLEHIYDWPGEIEIAYAAGVNCIRKHPLSGFAVWGDKTLQAKPSALDRVNVRRLLIVLEKAISTTLDYFLFEINDYITRTRVKGIIDSYLQDIKRRRGVYDFRVTCNDTNNTGEVIDRNELIVDVYVKPVKSINYIELNVVITRTGVSFDEVMVRAEI